MKKPIYKLIKVWYNIYIIKQNLRGGKQMFRLKVKCGKSWKLGWNVYDTMEDAIKRKAEMESVGHIVKIIKAI